MKSGVRYLLSLAASVLAASCGYTAPYQTSRPVVTNQGVEIALAGEQCYLNRTSEQFPTSVNDDQLHVDVKLDVVNQSDRPATLDLNALQLHEPAAAPPVVMHPRESGFVELAPGESRVVQLAFVEEPRLDRPQRLDCHHDLDLETGNAVAVGGRPARLAAIQFQPSR